jgi:hypothetical protein
MSDNVAFLTRRRRSVMSAISVAKSGRDADIVLGPTLTRSGPQ